MTLLARLILLAAALTLCCAATAFAASPTGNVGQNYIWNPVFADEFDGTSLDTSKWVTCYFWQVNDGCTNNDELQLYQPDDVSVGNGVLDLKAEPRVVVGANGKTYSYTSGMVSSGTATRDTTVPPKFSMTYGYMELRGKIPSGLGYWPAFWAIPDDHTWPPEIDTMEILGRDPTTDYMTVHYWDNTGHRSGSSTYWTGPDFSQGWHTYGVDWEPDAITWYVDGIRRYQFTNTSYIPNKPMYLVADLAVGGNWAGAPDATTLFPGHFLIDYMRAWQRIPDTTAPTVSLTSPARGSTVTRNSRVTLAATASDNTRVTAVEFYADGTKLCTDIASPYNCVWKAPDRRETATITAKAYDATLNTSSDTESVNVR